MSASDKKKLRKEEKMAQLTQKQQAEQKEAKKLKTNTIVFSAVIALVLVIGIGLIAYNWYTSSGLGERWTTAVEIGDHKLSAAELNYYYIDVLNQLSQDWYSMYLLQYEDGFKSTVALDQQQYKDEVGKTWGDYFVERAIEEASGVLAMCDSAKKEGYSLSADELATIDETILALETQGQLNNFASLNDYLQAMYGKGAQEKTFRTYLENVTLAQSYYNSHSEELEYTAEDITAYDEENRGVYSNFTYTYYEVSPDDLMEHDSETEHNHSEEETAAALKEAKEIAEKLAASGATNKEELDAAIAGLDMYKAAESTDETTGESTEETTGEASEETTGEATKETTGEATEETTGEATEETTGEATEETTGEATEETTGEATEETTGEATEETTGEATEETTGEATEETPEETPDEIKIPTSTQRTDYEYAYIETAVAEWLAEEGRKAGDIAAVPGYVLDDEGNATEEVETYYVVIFESEDKQEQKLVTARHILVKFEGGTEDPDTGDTVYSDAEKKTASDEAERIKAEFEAGDKTEDAFAQLAKDNSDDNAEDGGLYEDIYPGQMEEAFDDWCFDESRKPGDVDIVETVYGYHVMYYVEQQENTYREYLITADMRAEDTDEWFTGLRDGYMDATKVNNTSYQNTSIVLSN